LKKKKKSIYLSPVSSSFSSQAI